MIQRLEGVQVLQIELAVLHFRPHRLQRLFQRPQAGVGRAVGVVQRVHAEVAVVGRIAEVAAVGPIAFPGFVFRPYAVIHPLPYAAADQTLAAVKGLPVVQQRAGAQAHGVGVLA